MKIAFDVDDTIWKVDKNYHRQVPDYDLIQVLRWFYNNGDDCFVWSGGGIEYAQMIVDKLGLTDLITVIPKVALGDKSNPYKIDIAFDDEETSLAKVDITVRHDVFWHCCYECGCKAYGKPPEEDMMGITVMEGTCPSCHKKKCTLIPVADFIGAGD